MDTFTILLSCMYEKDYEIIRRSNIYSDCVIINQCNENSKKRITIDNNKVCLWVNTPERGLSKSRNLAIDNSSSDICLIADDDEIFVNNIDNIILKAYRKIPQADIIVFDIKNYQKNIRNKIFKFNRLQLLRVSSVQITFKKKAIKDNNIKFDVKLGAGTGNGAGEENKFLLDAYDKGLQIYHYPINIAELRENNDSTWFKGYDEDYFYKRGASTRYILGFWLSCAYAVYFLIFKYGDYKNNISFANAGLKLFKGILDNKLGNKFR